MKSKLASFKQGKRTTSYVLFVLQMGQHKY